MLVSEANSERRRIKPLNILYLVLLACFVIILAVTMSDATPSNSTPSMTDGKIKRGGCPTIKEMYGEKPISQLSVEEFKLLQACEGFWQ
jgi:hypothetical protein